MQMFTAKQSRLLFSILIPCACVSFQPNATAADWDGFSVTGLVGAMQQRTKISTSAGAGPTAASYFTTTDFTQIAAAGSGDLSGSKGAGSLKVGYSKQYGNVVAGIDISADTGFDQSFSNGAIWLSAPPSRFNINQRVKADSMVGIRPRIGWAWDNTLVYLTAGVAAARVTLDTTFRDNYVAGGGGGAFGSSSKSETRIGTVFGFGGEYALSKAWSLSMQYLYIDFGNMSNSTTVRHPGFSTNTNAINSSAELRNQSVMVGLTYRFK